MPEPGREVATASVARMVADIRHELEGEDLDEGDRADLINDLGYFEAIGSSLRPVLVAGPRR